MYDADWLPIPARPEPSALPEPSLRAARHGGNEHLFYTSDGHWPTCPDSPYVTAFSARARPAALPELFLRAERHTLSERVCAASAASLAGTTITAAPSEVPNRAHTPARVRLWALPEPSLRAERHAPAERICLLSRTLSVGHDKPGAALSYIYDADWPHIPARPEPSALPEPSHRAERHAPAEYPRLSSAGRRLVYSGNSCITILSARETFGPARGNSAAIPHQLRINSASKPAAKPQAAPNQNRTKTET